MSKLKPEDLFDPSKLSESSLRKYQSYFRIESSDQDLNHKIKDHFQNELKVDYNQVIEKMLELKREERQTKARGSRPMRANI